MHMVWKFFVVSLLTAGASRGAVYYVSPAGDDDADGLSEGSSWQTVAKVNASDLNPGDAVLFQRDGVWGEALRPSDSGTISEPITFADFGSGALPTFTGAEVLSNALFSAEEGTTYRISIADEVYSALVENTFLLGGTPVASVDSVEDVKATSGSWIWESGVLYINTGGPDPSTDGRSYTAIVREDLVFAHAQSNLVFRHLAVDGSARYDAGYGFRTQGAENILMEDCAAYRCGKHHFGIINTAGFIGRRLYGAHAMPAQGNGGATTFVSYSDHTYSGTTSEWTDCFVEEMEDTYTGLDYPAFYTHGEGMGGVLVSNMVSYGAGISIEGPNMVVVGGRIHDGKLAVYGSDALVRGLEISGPDGTMDIYGNRNLIENCLIHGGTPYTSYKSVITVLGRDNILRYNTVVMGEDAAAFSTCLALTANDSGTIWYGNVLHAQGRVLRQWSGSVGSNDVAYADFNSYNEDAEFKDGSAEMDLAQWQGLGVDLNSAEESAEFVDAAATNYQLLVSSSAVDAVATNLYPATDILGVSRALDGDADGTPHVDIGAYELAREDVDTDGDGLNDAAEVVAGTDAVDAGSLLAVLDATYTNGSWKVAWVGGHSKTQHVEFSTILTASTEWRAVHTNPPPMSTTNSVGLGPSENLGFFRITVE